jgi:hypothetical protein
MVSVVVSNSFFARPAASDSAFGTHESESRVDTPLKALLIYCCCNERLELLMKLLFTFVTIHAWISSQHTFVLGLLREDHQQCGNTTTFCSSKSLTAAVCCVSEFSPTHFGCRNVDDVHSYCCKPGPPLEPSTTTPNCLIIGDSVSIGYTPFAAELLGSSVCQLQHGPWDLYDGGASDTSYGLSCLNNFLVTQRQTAVAWDVIVFNFGLHNLVNTETANDEYRSELLEITLRLSLRMPHAKLIYATTTPYMKDALQNNSIVEDLNDIAKDILQKHFVASIDILDLYKVVTSHW